MALKPTIYKATLNLVDMNRDVYTTEKLTLALHPSETEIRMMVRVLVYALNYHQDLSFTKGLSTADEPDLWQVAPTGEVVNWIELGQASPERIRKAVSRAEAVMLYAYGSEVDVWWPKHREAMLALSKCRFYAFDANELAVLESVCKRNMELTITLSEAQLFVAAGDQSIELQLQRLE